MTRQRATSLYICSLTILLPLLLVPGIDEFALLPRLLCFLVLTLILSVWTRTASGSTFRVPPGVTLALLAFWGVMAASALWAVNPFRSTFDLAKHVPAFAMFLLLTRYLPKSAIPSLLTCHAVTGLIVSLFGIAEYFGVQPVDIPSTGRPSATFAFRNLAGAYLATGIPLAFLSSVISTDSWRKNLGLAAGGSMMLFLFYTRARASWVGLLGGVVFAVILWGLARKARESSVSKNFFPVPIWGIAFTFLLSIPLGLQDDRLTERHTQRFDEKKADMMTAIVSITREGGDRGRFQMWRSTLDMIGDHPLLGVGLGNWEYHYPPYDNGNQIQATSSPHRPHNDLLWIWSETGTLGLLTFLALLAVILRGSWAGMLQTDSQGVATIIAATASMVAFLGVGMFSFPFERVPPEFNFWLSCSLVFIVLDRQPAKPRRHPGLLLPIVLLGALGVTIYHTCFDWWYARAHMAYLKKDYQSAAGLAERALTYGPFDHQAYLIIGEGAAKREDYEVSEWAFQTALSYHPNFTNAYNGLGLVAYGRGENEKALEYYDKAFETVPFHHLVHHNRGLVFEKLGVVDSAIASYRRGIRGDYGAPLVNLGAIYHRQGNVEEAIKAYERASNLAVPSIEAWFNLGNLYGDQREFGKAGDAYLRFLQSWPQQDSVWTAARKGLSQSYSGYGVQLEIRGQVDSARIAYERALEIDQGAYLNWFNLGNVLRKKSQLGKAARAYERALDANPKHIDTYNNLGMTYRDLNRDKDAVNLYQRAKQIDPENAILNYNLGQTLMALGEDRTAEETLAVFRRNWTGEPELIHYYMGNAYTQGERYQEARASYRRFLTVWDKDDGIRQSATSILESLAPEEQP